MLPGHAGDPSRRQPLELDDGATGLDAARAIGPRLAQRPVAVEVDGELRDLRLPLPDGDASAS